MKLFVLKYQFLYCHNYFNIYTLFHKIISLMILCPFMCVYAIQVVFFKIFYSCSYNNKYNNKCKNLFHSQIILVTIFFKFLMQSNFQAFLVSKLIILASWNP